MYSNKEVSLPDKNNYVTLYEAIVCGGDDVTRVSVLVYVSTAKWGSDYPFLVGIFCFSVAAFPTRFSVFSILQVNLSD